MVLRADGGEAFTVNEITGADEKENGKAGGRRVPGTEPVPCERAGAKKKRKTEKIKNLQVDLCASVFAYRGRDSKFQRETFRLIQPPVGLRQ